MSQEIKQAFNSRQALEVVTNATGSVQANRTTHNQIIMALQILELLVQKEEAEKAAKTKIEASPVKIDVKKIKEINEKRDLEKVSKVKG